MSWRRRFLFFSALAVALKVHRCRVLVRGRARMLLTLASRQSCIIIIHAFRGFAHRLKALLNASVRQKLPSVVGRVLESIWKFRT